MYYYQNVFRSMLYDISMQCTRVLIVTECASLQHTRPCTQFLLYALWQTNTRESNNEAISHTINKWCCTVRRAGQSMGVHRYVCTLPMRQPYGPYIHAALHEDDNCSYLWSAEVPHYISVTNGNKPLIISDYYAYNCQWSCSRLLPIPFHLSSCCKHAHWTMILWPDSSSGECWQAGARGHANVVATYTSRMVSKCTAPKDRVWAAVSYCENVVPGIIKIGE